jgi:hypothetical protein
MLVSGKNSRPTETSSDMPALSSYIVTALGIIVLSLVTGAGELALIGFFAMMPWVIAAGLKMLKS